MDKQEEHEKLIDELQKAIQSKLPKAVVLRSFKYKLTRKQKDPYVIDLAVLIDFNLLLFETKTGVKERKALKQLTFHKEALLSIRDLLAISENLIFSEIKLFWITAKEGRIVNVDSNKEDYYLEFLQNPLPFILE